MAINGIDINSITPEMIQQAQAARQSSNASNSNMVGGIDINSVTPEMIIKAKDLRGNDALNSIQKPDNQAKWDALMTGGDAVETSPVGQANPKLPAIVQAGIGAISFGNAALERMMKMGSAVGKLETSAINTLFGTNLQAPDVQDSIDITTGQVNKGLDQVAGKNNENLSSILGINTRNTGSFAGDLAPSLFLPQAKAAQGAGLLSKIGTAALNGAIQGGTYSASEAASGSSEDILKAGGFGAAIGGALGGAMQTAQSAIAGIFKYAGNKYFPANTNKAKDATNMILDEVGPKSNTVAADTVKVANSIYNDIKTNTAPMIDDLYSKAYAKEIDGLNVRALKADPNMAMTIEQYSNKFMRNTNPSNVMANRYKLLNTKIIDGRENKLYNPNSLESWDYIARSMQQDINGLYSKGKTVDAGMLVDYKNKIFEQLDQISPDYAAARLMHTENQVMSELFDSVGLNNLTGNNSKAYKKISSMLLDTKNDPEVIRTIRDAVVKRNPDVWKNIVRETFENRTNAATGLRDATPLDFMKGVMFGGKNKLVYDALNFPGNEKTLAKLEALGLIFKEVNKNTISENVLNSGLDSIPLLGNLKGAKVNEFNKNAIDFVFKSKYSNEFDNLIASSAGKLDTRDIANATLKMLLPNPNPNIPAQITRNIVIDKPATVVGDLFAPPKKDNK